MLKLEHNIEMDETIHKLRSSMLQANDYMQLLEAYKERVLTVEREKEFINAGVKILGYTPNILFNEKELLENPYYKDIKLDDINYKTVRCKNLIMPKRLMIGMGFYSYIDDYLMVQQPVGYFKKAISIPTLKQGGTIWMSPTISELRSLGEGIAKGHGDCLTFGLGIGMLQYLWLLKEEVKSVTVVEKNPDVIHIFKTFIQPQFKTDKKITIIEGDAFDYYTEEFIRNYDYTYVDFWESNNDGLDMYMKLMEKKVRGLNINYWIEDSILYDVKYTVAPYLMNLYKGKEIYDYILSTTGMTREIAIKTNRYFKSLSKTISTEKEFIELLHSKEIMQDILSIRLKE